MNREQFDMLVTQVEQRFAQRPRALRLWVAYWAAVGYAGLLAGPALVVALSGLCFAGALRADTPGAVLLGALGAIILISGGWSVVRVLWVRLDPPEGVRLGAAETPELQRALAELRATLGCRPFHEIVLIPDCNAAVAHRPRLGVFGWPRHYLLLGLPLLEGMPVEEFKAVLAHEFAHLSHEHARFSQWIYRLRQSWELLFARLRQPYVRSLLSPRPLIVAFIEWFWPRFNAHAFVLSRADEYQADAEAARLVGALAIRSALVRLCVLHGQTTERFWPSVWLSAAHSPEAPAGVLAGLRETVRSPGSEESRRWVTQGFLAITTQADTHPCLTDRLRPLGGVTPVPVLAAVTESAADLLLGTSRASLAEKLEISWRRLAAEVWRERHLRAVAQGDRLDRLASAVTPNTTDHDVLWEEAHAKMDLHGLPAVEPLLRRVLEADPSHGPANFHLGRLLVERSDPAAEAHLQSVLDRDDNEGFAAAAQMLHELFQRTGQTCKLQALAARLDQREQEQSAARHERCGVSPLDTLLPHGLTPEELAPLKALLVAEPHVIAADLGRKQMRHLPKQRMFLLSVHGRRNWLGLENHDRTQEAVNRLFSRVVLPGRVLIFSRGGSFRELATRLAQVPGARVHVRSDR